MASAEIGAGHVYALGFHADYRCRSSGECCSSGWEIPVAPPAEARLRAALASGALRLDAHGVPLFRSRRELPDGARVAFGLDAHGRCAFFEPGTRLCAVHRQVGVAALPPSCRQFPRIALLTPVGTFLTLSHYCPTAAGQLFREDDVPSIAADPPAFPADEPWEGLDARQAWPPLLKPGVLLGWDGYVLWQERAVSLLLSEGQTPEAAVAALRLRATRACEWTASKGTLLAWLERIPDPAQSTGVLDFDAAAANWRCVAAQVPDSLRFAAPPLGPGAEPALAWAEAHARLVTPHWERFAWPVRRYLAAKVFASWAAMQEDGLTAWSRAVETALAVLHVEATRQCIDASAPLDAERLAQAFRRADLLLLHLARSAGEDVTA
jgi:Fe-S-cluster containining protein